MQQNATMMDAIRQQQPPQLFNGLPDLLHNIDDFDDLSGPSNGNIDAISDWGSFRKAFASKFMLEKTLTGRWQEMQSRNQRQGENTAEYFFDKLRLCKALNMGLDETKTQVAVGLWSKETSTAIINRTDFDADELLRNITELENLEAARRLRINMSRDTSRNQRGGNHLVPGVKGEIRQGQQKESDKPSVDKVSSQPGSSALRNPSGENVSGNRVCYRCRTFGETLSCSA